MLHASVNFWSAFTPGRQAGATLRSEVYIKDANPQNAQNAQVFTVPEPKASKPSGMSERPSSWRETISFLFIS